LSPIIGAVFLRIIEASECSSEARIFPTISFHFLLRQTELSGQAGPESGPVLFPRGWNRNGKSSGNKKLQRQRQALSDLKGTNTKDPGFTKWKRDTELAITVVFGKETRHLHDFASLRWWPGSYSMHDPEPAFREAFLNGRKTADALLESMIDEIAEYWTETQPSDSGGNDQPLLTKATREVFLVHGHNREYPETVARFLEKLKLKPIILHEQPNKGRTIIEKFVDYSDVSFAVILLTGDDRGGLLDAPVEEQHLRARQNVILELGFFLGRLGRGRVCTLYAEGVEIPSDYDGIVFVPLDRSGAWRLALAREIKEAQIPIDMNDAV